MKSRAKKIDLKPIHKALEKARGILQKSKPQDAKAKRVLKLQVKRLGQLMRLTKTTCRPGFEMHPGRPPGRPPGPRP